MTDVRTNPGSPEAKRLGCTCPVLDNAYGEGAVVDGQVNSMQFYLDPDCAIHQDKRGLDAGPNGERTNRRLVTAKEITRDDRASDPTNAIEDEQTRERSSSEEL